MERSIYLSFLAALGTAAAVVLLCIILSPLAKPLAWALIIGTATIPYYEKLVEKMPGHPNRSAGVMVLFMTLSMILPLMALLLVIIQNSGTWFEELSQLAALIPTSERGLSRLPGMSRVFALVERIGLDISGYAARFGARISQYLLDTIAASAKNLAGMLLTLALTLFSLFFYYRDGDRILSATIARFIGTRRKTLYYLYEIRYVTTAVMVGTLFTCFVQGVLAGIGYYASGVPLPIPWGIVTAVAGLAPVVGTGIIWVPLVLAMAVTGKYLTALLLALWCLLVVVGVTDNVIRPLAIGGKSDIPTLAVVLGAVSGVVIMGLIGLVLGPILFSLLAAFWRDLVSERP